MPEISALYIYPLKSATGIKLSQMEIVTTGPQYDREWMLVNKNLNFISQRTHPSMGLLKTRMNQHNLIIETPGGESLAVGLQEFGSRKVDEFKLFGKPVAGNWLSKNYDLFFSDYLGENVQLIRTPESKPRRTSGNHGPVTPVNFADGYPFLLTNTATLGELNNKMESPVDMLRFRPNIVIKGMTPGEEDTWREFEINGMVFHCAKACSRCSIINIEPGSLNQSNAITKTLKGYRLKDGQVIFGQNLSHTQTGTIEVGQKLNSIQIKPTDSTND